MVVEGWLERAAATRPAHTALATAHGSCTYAQLLAGADACAARLLELGVERGQRVAIALPAGLAFAQTLHACLLLGVIAVPVDLRLAAEERERIVAGAAVLVEQPLCEPSQFAGARGGVGAHRKDHEVGEREDEHRASEGGGNARKFDGAARARVRARSTNKIGEHQLESTAVIVHTSGTTSVPKPVELTYGNFLWSALGSAVALGLDPRERWLCTLPLAHVGGLSILLRSAIYATTAVVHERFETDLALHALRNQQITLVSVVATTLARLLDAGLDQPASLRCALAGGGPVPTALLERAARAGVPVSQTYGLTETCSQVTATPVASLGVGELSSDAGPPLFCTRVELAADGEIMVASPTVAAATCDNDGWLRTGDLGELDERGRLRVTGRKADTIVSGGENVAPTEVEAVLESHPDVLEAAVVGRVDQQWGEAVTAIVVARPGASLVEAELRTHCSARLASFKIPKRFALTGGPLPRTPSGKLLRREL
ncbi:MAG TPA: AMP-binding protein [Solirubrobacteraceae bacterium]|nr:AMP-binding protein [Solirubrobacteraceae bacterium]